MPGFLLLRSGRRWSEHILKDFERQFLLQSGRSLYSGNRLATGQKRPLKCTSSIGMFSAHSPPQHFLLNFCLDYRCSRNASMSHKVRVYQMPPFDADILQTALMLTRWGNHSNQLGTTRNCTLPISGISDSYLRLRGIIELPIIRWRIFSIMRHTNYNGSSTTFEPIVCSEVHDIDSTIFLAASKARPLCSK